MMYRNCFVLFLLVSIVLWSACASDRQKALAQIEVLEKRIAKDSLSNPDKSVFMKIAAAYLDYAKRYNDDPKAQEMLFKAASINNSLHNFSQAARLYKDVYLRYPRFNKAAVSLFLSGFIYENYLHDLSKAQKDYLEFLSVFPHHELNKDVKYSIGHLGFSQEEMIYSVNKNANSAVK